MDTLVLIPAYKPEECLAKLSEKLRSEGLAVLIVDDGSGEAFHPVFSSCEPYATVIGYGKNRGKGGALKYGLQYIKDQLPSVQYIVTADADGQHAVKDILACAETVRERDCLVLGVRGFTGKVPLKSRLGNGLSRFAYAIACSSYLWDNQTGLRAFPSRDLDWMLLVEGERYEYEINVLMSAGKRNFPIAEIPIETIYIENNRASHFDPVRDTLRLHAKIWIASCGSVLSLLQAYLAAILCYYGELFPFLHETAWRPLLLVLCCALFRTGMSFLINSCIFFMGRHRGKRTHAHHILTVAIRIFVEMMLFAFFFCLLRLPFAAALALSWVIVVIPMYFIQKFWRGHLHER